MFLDDPKTRCFLSLAKTLNFTKTAEQVFMTQQNVSHNIAALEKELQIQLFIRNTRSVKLTDEGREFYEYISGVSEELNGMLVKLRKQQDPNKIKFGYQNYIAHYGKLKTAHMNIRDKYPNLTVEGNRYSPAVLRKMLEDGDMDIIVIYKRFVEPILDKYNWMSLCSIPQYYMMSQDMAVPKGEDELEFIRKQPFIIDFVEHEQPADMNNRLKMEYDRYGFTGKTMVSPDRDSAYSYAEMGYGVVVGTDISVMCANRSLRKVKCNDEELIIAWKNDKNPAVKDLALAMQKAFSTVK